MATVQRWTGIEVRALREAKRMSIREFSAHLGVSERMVSKWEAGRENIRPRPVNQAALDTALARCDPDTKARFSFLTGDSLVPEESSGAFLEPIGASHVRHPVDGRLMARVDGS
ncbi:helix-turn-helix domain-containing protein, partial [Amycolatopsis pigmentata]